jgi:hypothetical protein
MVGNQNFPLWRPKLSRSVGEAAVPDSGVEHTGAIGAQGIPPLHQLAFAQWQLLQIGPFSRTIASCSYFYCFRVSISQPASKCVLRAPGRPARVVLVGRLGRLAPIAIAALRSRTMSAPGQGATIAQQRISFFESSRGGTPGLPGGHPAPNRSKEVCGEKFAKNFRNFWNSGFHSEIPGDSAASVSQEDLARNLQEAPRTQMCTATN